MTALPFTVVSPLTVLIVIDKAGLPAAVRVMITSLLVLVVVPPLLEGVVVDSSL
ncbi:hypothetical protein D3C81_1999800 [compost metagenome]